MKHNLAKYLEDVRISADDIISYTTGIKSYKELEDNQMLFDAVYRRFAIIGEAVYQINKYDNSLPITDKNKIMGLRHIIVHDYDLVRPPDIFIIVRDKLPVLKAEIIALLEIYG